MVVSAGNQGLNMKRAKLYPQASEHPNHAKQTLCTQLCIPHSHCVSVPEAQSVPWCHLFMHTET